MSRLRKVLLLGCAAALLGGSAIAVAKVSHAGWYPNMRVVMDTGPAGQSHVLRGAAKRHNELLGGYGNDTIYGGPIGDVLWGDYHPPPQPSSQTTAIFAGNGKNFIYTDYGTNFIHTGTNPKTFVMAFDGQGKITCGSSKQTIVISHKSKPRFKLIGCGTPEIK